jgi:hypothetical protein
MFARCPRRTPIQRCFAIVMAIASVPGRRDPPPGLRAAKGRDAGVLAAIVPRRAGPEAV